MHDALIDRYSPEKNVNDLINKLLIVIKGDFFVFEGSKVGGGEHLIEVGLGDMFGSDADNPGAHGI